MRARRGWLPRARAVRQFPGIADRSYLAGRYVGVLLHGVEAQRMPVRVEHLGQDPAQAGPAYAGVGVGIAGDTEPVDVLGRDWMTEAMTAATLAGRIAAVAAVSRQIMERTGALFAVAQQAAAVEPLIAGY
jgi:hypothetical protein